MLTITIEDKKYQCCSEWCEFTLKKFIDLSQIEIPERLMTAWTAQKEDDIKKITDSITDSDVKETFPEYYGKVISVLSNIPDRVIEILHEDLKTEFFDKYLRQFVLSLIYITPVNYDPDKIESFKLDGKDWWLPGEVSLYGNIIPMHKEKVLAFSEAADIDLSFQSMDIKWPVKLPLFMGIYCRQKNEEYSEDKAISREPIFIQSDMATVWSLLILHRTTYSRIVDLYPNVFKGSGTNQSEYKRSGLANFGWRGMIYEAAETGSMGTIKDVEDSKLYDFVSYLSFMRSQGKFNELTLKKNDNRKGKGSH